MSTESDTDANFSHNYSYARLFDPAREIPFYIKHHAIGYLYKKAGVMLVALSDAASRQGTLFDDVTVDARAARLMGILDAQNRQHGRDTVQLGAAGIQARWAMRADNRTPKYTTSWDEVPAVWAR